MDCRPPTSLLDGETRRPSAVPGYKVGRDPLCTLQGRCGDTGLGRFLTNVSWRSMPRAQLWWGDNAVEGADQILAAWTSGGRLSKFDPHTSPGNGPHCSQFTGEDTKAEKVRRSVQGHKGRRWQNWKSDSEVCFKVRLSAAQPVRGLLTKGVGTRRLPKVLPDNLHSGAPGQSAPRGHESGIWRPLNSLPCGHWGKCSGSLPGDSSLGVEKTGPH